MGAHLYIHDSQHTFTNSYKNLDSQENPSTACCTDKPADMQPMQFLQCKSVGHAFKVLLSVSAAKPARCLPISCCGISSYVTQCRQCNCSRMFAGNLKVGALKLDRACCTTEPAQCSCCDSSHLSADCVKPALGSQVKQSKLYN